MLLFAFIAVSVRNLVNFDIVIGLKTLDRFAKDLFHSRNLEQEERAGGLADVQQVEAEDESQLVLLVVSDEADERILALIHQVFVLLHLVLNFGLQLFVATPFFLRGFDLEFVDVDFLTAEEIDVGEFRLRQEYD